MSQPILEIAAAANGATMAYQAAMLKNDPFDLGAVSMLRKRL